jgi:hypothetical protein
MKSILSELVRQRGKILLRQIALVVARRKADAISNGVVAYRCSATAPMRLAKAAGEAMARDSGTMNALMTMSPQMPTE